MAPRESPGMRQLHADTGRDDAGADLVALNKLRIKTYYYAV